MPSVARLLERPAAQALVAAHGASFVTSQLRLLLAQLREAARAGAPLPLPEALDAQLRLRCAQVLAPRLRAVLNLTGTVIHTNLGRAVLAPEAMAQVTATMGESVNLEYDLEAGGRGDRDSLVEDLLCTLTGAQAATVVNNNAAAVLLVLAALAAGREVVVSRGEQVEIGGAFRMPEVVSSAGARMVEVGTTNRTHLHDYERAIGPQTALLLKVHSSNYAVQGFTSSVGESKLAALARARGVLLASDLGSGALLDMARWGLPREPTARAALAAGCDIVTFSGDKLLGGPQVGLIVGSRASIDRIRKHPLKRALRLSKLPLAALEATLRLYLQPENLTRCLPTLRWLTRSQAEVAKMASSLLVPMAQALEPGYTVRQETMLSQIGSGSLPVERLPSSGLAIAPAALHAPVGGAELRRLEQAFRGLPLPVLGRLHRGELLLDCRCLDCPQPLLHQLPRLRTSLNCVPPAQG